MNIKRILISSIVIASTLSVSAQVNAKELQAQVQKSPPQASKVQQSSKYANIDRLIEYNHYAAADELLKEILSQNPDDVQALSLRAISYAKNHKLAPAQTEIDRMIKKYPNSPQLHYAQGMVYMNRQTSSDVDYIRDTRNLINNSIKEFVSAVNLDNKYYQAYNAMGVATLRLGNRSDAEELFKTALKINPQYATAYDNLGVLELMGGNLDAAEKYFMQSMKHNTTNPTSMYHMGQVETARAEYSKALTWINHSIHLNPNSSPALNLQGELYLKQGNQPAAINSFRKAILVKPENSRPYVNLANVYEDRADEEFAMVELKTAIAINPNFQEAKIRIADMALYTRKYDQALEYYSKLLGDEKFNDQGIIGMANTYYEMSKDNADSGDMTTNKEVYLAYEYIHKAIEKTPDDLKLHLAKIKLARLTHQQPLSKENLNYIIQAAGNNLMDSVIKGEAYLVLGREKDAVYTFENAINFSNNVEDDLYLSEVLVHNKQFRTARVALKKALTRDSNNIIAKNGLAYIDICEIKSGEFFDVANRQYKEGNYASTVEYCNRAVDFFHNSPEIAKLKAMAYEKELNYQGAAKYYTQYLSMNPNAADKVDVAKKINKFKTTKVETKRY